MLPAANTRTFRPISETPLHGAVTFGLFLFLAAPAIADDTANTKPKSDDGITEVVVTGDKPTSPDGKAEDGYRETTGQLGSLGNVTLKDIPYSVNVTSGELIENSNAHTLGEALKTNPTATLLMSPSGYSSMTRMMVRGFTAADQSEMRDGLVDRSFSFPPLENVERIEVFNGFSSFLNGFAATGGSVNYVSKKPTTDPLYSLSTGVYGGGILFGQADVGGTVSGLDDKGLGYRINAYKEDGSTYIDGSNQARTFGSARFEQAVHEKSKIWADVWHQEMTATGLQTYFNLGTGVKVPSASDFDATKQYGQNWTYNKIEKTLLGAGFDAALNDTFTLRTGYRYGTMWRQYAYIGATLNANGTYTEKETTTPRQHETTHSAYALLDAEFDTYGVKHKVTAGYNGTDYSYDRGNDVSTTLGTSTLSSVATYADPSLSVGTSNTWQSNYLDNFLIGDRVDLTEDVSVLGGVTYAMMKQTASGTGTAISTSNYHADHLTPSVGLMYKPFKDTTVYASYMEALVGGESTTSSVAVNRYQVLAPSVSKQYETGVKFTAGRIDTNVALFRIDKVNSEIDPADNVFKQDGREIHQGVEVTFTGKALDNLTLGGGFTLMDAHVENASANPATENKIPVNVPERQARLFAEYALPFLPEVTLTSGVNYFGRRPIDVLNTDYLGSAVTADAGIRYEPTVLGHKIKTSLTVSNLFDRHYWSYYRSGDGLLEGTPRIVSASLKATW